MTINEAQLDTWSKQGSVTQSRDTYASIKSCLERSDAPYHGKDYAIFLQGSYGNDTNIYADSDVDLVIRLDSTFYRDLSALSEEDKVAYSGYFSAASYKYADFKAAVTEHLKRFYGASVQPGKKAIFVEGSGNRRDADVLPAAQYRKYYRFRSGDDQRYADGIVFWTADGVEIVNYPKQHSANCTTKHQATGSWFKPMVRIVKNMRNAMIAADYIKEGLAPSYFLEGTLYNVPNDKFGGSYQQTLVAVLSWLHECDRSKLLCANEMYKLLHSTSPVTWRAESFEAFLSAAIRYWNDR
jgi:hypothetical protein